MNIFIAMLMGLVQGVCEFLPVSSSGHLVLVQNIFNVTDGALFFDTMLHVGTLIAVFAVFWETIFDLIRHPLQKKMGMLLISTAVTTVIAIVFKDFFVGAYEGALLGVGFIATAVILFLTERVGMTRGTIGRMSGFHALVIGLMQGVAILPGISRSGSTIAGALFTKLDRREAAEYSFLLCIPAILGSVVLQLFDVVEGGIGEVNWLFIIVGMIIAAVSGFFAIRVMLRVIVKRKLKIFAYYTLCLGVLVLLDQFVFNVFFVNPLV